MIFVALVFSRIFCAISIPETLPISDVEVCAVFGNLLENALEAIQKCTEKSFSLSAGAADGKLCIQLRNSVQKTVRFKDGLPLTTKHNGGIGTKSIADTLARHAGLVEFSQDGQEFVAQIILPLCFSSEISSDSSDFTIFESFIR